MTSFSEALKDWRARRRFSQLELAMEADVSARHIAFLETGRARPSPAMIGRLAEALQIPLHERNHLLTLAGFAARYPGRPWNDPDMAPVRAAVGRILSQHAPFPGIAIDRLWNVRLMNDPARSLFGAMGLDDGASLLDLMTSGRLAPFIGNWPDVAHHAAQRLRVESAAQGGLVRLEHAADILAAVPGAAGARPGPVLPTIIRSGDRQVSLFAIIAQFGTPEDLLLEDMRIELFFPVDAASAEVLHAIAPAAPGA